MHTIDRTLLHINIDLSSESILFSQLTLVGLLDLMIHLCCTNTDHASSYIEELACTDIGLWRMLVRIDYLIVSSSHDMSTINCYDLCCNQPPELWVGCLGFITSFHNLIIEDN